MLGGRELLLPASIAVAMETAQPNSEAKGPGSNLPPEISMADQTLVPFGVRWKSQSPTHWLRRPAEFWGQVRVGLGEEVRPSN